MKKFFVSAISLMLAATVVSAQRTEGFAKGLGTRDYTHSGTPLLDSFDFQFTKGQNLGSTVDHHLTQIMVLPDSRAQNLRFGFHDKNLDDEYFFRVSHHSVDDSRIQQVARGLDICNRRRCTVNISKPDGDFLFALIGFGLSFRNADHHIDEVGILESDGDLTVYFNDKNDDDLFLWSVQYAWVPRVLVSEVGESSGSRERRAATDAIHRGRSIITGFKLNFEPYFTPGHDHHVRAVGVLTPDDGRVEVLYADKNGDDGFDWQVRWAILK